MYVKRQIPINPPPARNLKELLAQPGRWFLLASRPVADVVIYNENGQHITRSPWEYRLADGVGANVSAARKEILAAADIWRIFCPQRKLTEEIQWLGIALRNPPSGPRNLPMRTW
jgi:hypothetical protein